MSERVGKANDWPPTVSASSPPGGKCRRPYPLIRANDLTPSNVERTGSDEVATLPPLLARVGHIRSLREIARLIDEDDRAILHVQ
jgi:hypothetical protein